MRKSVEASAPGKLMLYGEHAVVYGYPSIVTAVDQRIFAEAQISTHRTFSVVAPEMSIERYEKPVSEVGNGDIPSSVAFLERLFQRFLEKFPGVDGVQVTTRSEFSSEFGFGSSSAVTTAFARALNELFNTGMSQKDMFDLCYQAVLDVQGVGSGFDLAAAIWGGTLYYIKPARVVEQLSAAGLPLIVGYTGIKAGTTALVKQVERLRADQPEEINGIFEQIRTIVELAKTAILAADWARAGELMKENQVLLQNLLVSSPELDALISAAIGNGAFGAKLSGAGGGDCMIALSATSNEAQLRVKEGIESAIKAHSTMAMGRIVHVHTNAEGVRLE